MVINWTKTFENKRFIILGGRPGIGKTNISLQLANSLPHDGEITLLNFNHTTNIVNIGKQIPINIVNFHIKPNQKELTETLYFASKKGNCFIIDTLQDLTDDTTENNAYSLVKALKKFAKENNCTFVITSNLSRNIENRRCHIPEVKDLQEKYNHICIFDCIGLIYRESYYDPLGDRRTQIFFKDAHNKNLFVLTAENLQTYSK